MTVGWNDASTTFSGTIVDSVGGGQLLKAGDGTLTLAGVNTYSGSTTVAGGMLLATNAASLPGYNKPGLVSVVGGPAVLALLTGGTSTAGWNSSQISALLANVTLASGASANSTPVIGIDTTNGNFTFGNNVSQPVTLAKLGANTLFLTGSNANSGGTQINAGVLNINGDPALGAASAPLAFTGSGTLQAGVDGIVLNANRTITVDSGATATIDTQAFKMSIAGSITGQGALAKIGAGTLTLTGSIDFPGNLFLTSGALVINNRQEARRARRS